MSAFTPYVLRVVEVIVEPAIQLLIFLAFIYFSWGILLMIAGAGNETKRTEGKKHIMYGILGMIIMLGALGIFAVLKNTVLSLA